MYRFTMALLSRERIAILAALPDYRLGQWRSLDRDRLPSPEPFGIFTSRPLFFEETSLD